MCIRDRHNITPPVKIPSPLAAQYYAVGPQSVNNKFVLVVIITKRNYAVTHHYIKKFPISAFKPFSSSSDLKLVCNIISFVGNLFVYK